MESKVDVPVSLNAVGIPNENAVQIAEKLRASRDLRHQNIESIAKELRLNPHTLENIESGRWDCLPQGAVGRSLVRLYAKYLAVPLPEFDKFLETPITSELSNTHTNLDKIIECARIKHLEQMNGIQRFFYQLFNNGNKKVKKILTTDEKQNLHSVHTSKEEKNSTTVLEQQAQQPNVDKQVVHQEKIPTTSVYKKNWAIGGVFSFLMLVIIGTAFVLTRRDSDDLEQFENSVVLENTPIVSDISNQTNNLQNSSSIDEKTSDFVQEETQKGQVSSPTQVNNISNQIVHDQAPTVAAVSQEETKVQPAPDKIVVGIQKMKIDILSPVAIKVDTDEHSVFDGMANPGVMTFEFQKDAKLLIQDSSKVKLSYAGWNAEQLSTYARKRVIVLRAKRFINNTTE